MEKLRLWCIRVVVGGRTRAVVQIIAANGKDAEYIYTWAAAPRFALDSKDYRLGSFRLDFFEERQPQLAILVTGEGLFSDCSINLHPFTYAVSGDFIAWSPLAHQRLQKLNVLRSQ